MRFDIRRDVSVHSVSAASHLRWFCRLTLFAAVIGCSRARGIECGPQPTSTAARPTTSDSLARRWTFDELLGQPPSGFEFAATGGLPGVWRVRASGFVAQEDSTRASLRFALAL